MTAKVNTGDFIGLTEIYMIGGMIGDIKNKFNPIHWRNGLLSQSKPTNHMPTSPEPYWRDSVQLPSFDRLTEDQDADVVIVGGGITGITAAYLLVKEGYQVVLLEASNILNGTTGHTTAKITAQHGLIYDEFIQHFGEDKARQYYEANMDALRFIQQTVTDHDIDCDYTEEDAYIYTNSDRYVDKIHKEAQAYHELGIDGGTVSQMPLDVQMKTAIVMKQQAQFHPLKYLAHLVQEITQAGGKIYEHTTAVDADDQDEQPTVITREGHKIKGDYVLSCSHYPFNDVRGFYFTRLTPNRSYIIGIEAQRDFPGGMYITAEEPTRSLRSVTIDGKPMVLVVGESHKTGQGVDMIQHYEALESFAEQTLGIKNFKYRWSAQDLTTLDKIPYIGPFTDRHPNLLVATGYRKWGMTGGTAAAMLMRDIVMDKDSSYKELFSPSRFQADPSLKKFLKQNADVAGHLIKGKFEPAAKKLDDLSVDDGAVVIHQGRRIGAYKDHDRELHTVDTTCTHMGCEVEWNHGDRTWDCPCHGSRFSIKGEVIEGPAEQPLQQIKL